ncbi:MAG: hypothetical protein GX220_07815 [Treponema sp.]|nr:hypothetical protein [Treponema sp.]
MLCDCHSHKISENKICLCSLNFKEWKKNQLLKNNFTKCSYGIHPCYLDKNEIDNLYSLLKSNPEKIDAIGEIGLDYFNNTLIETKKLQKFFFEMQLDFAIEFNKPIIIHCRKAVNDILYFSSKLKKISSVIFHEYWGTVVEANYLLKRGVNAFFSFGSSILKGRKKSIECVKHFSLDFLFAETDSPFQNTKLIDVYNEISKLKNMSLEIVEKNIENNFNNVFSVHL